MKHILSALILFSSTMLAHANDPAKPPVQFNQGEVLKQALEYLKTAKPDVDSQKLVFHGAQYNYWAIPAGYIQKKADGSESYVKVAEADETFTVTFKVLGSEVNVVEDGRNCVRYKTLNVNFPRPVAPTASIGEGTLTEYGNPVK